MILSTLNYVPERNVESLGMVKGNVVQAKHIGRDFMAGMKNLVGGEVASYTDMLTEAREIATRRMVDEATRLGADAIIDIEYSSSNISQGMAEVLAYGTAVKIK